LNAISYELYRSQFEGARGEMLEDNLTALSFNDVSAVPGVFYYYTVRAENDRGLSDFSNTDRGYRAATDGCDADCDGDGVCDAQEIIDGTGVCDPGSFQLHLQSPAFSKWNTFLSQQSYLELIANGTQAINATVTFYDIDGNQISQIIQTVAAGLQVDIDVNAAVRASNSYGLIRIDFNQREPGATLTGRVSTYRNNRIGGGFSFAFARELRNPTRGWTHATGNSSDPQAQGFLVPNWAEITNPTDQQITLNYNLYNQEGTQLHSQRLTVAPRQSRDIQAGHEFGEGVYIAEFKPVDGATKYLASVTRYSSNSTSGAEADTYNFAFTIDGKAGNGSEQFMPVSNTEGSTFSQTNYVEVLNVREIPVDVTLIFRDASGAILNQSLVRLLPRNQYHFPAFSFIPKGQKGSVEIRSSAIGGLVAQSVVYFHDNAANLLQTAYVSPGRIGGQDVQAASYNRNLQMRNELTLISTTTLPTSAVIETRFQGQLISTVQQDLGASVATALDLSNSVFGTQPNTYGMQTIRVDGPRKLVGEMLRIRVDTTGKMDFVMPTAVQ